MFECLFDSNDSARARYVLDQLDSCGISFALGGGAAVRARLKELGSEVPLKKLNDLDIVVAAWSDLPNALVRVFLVNHVHPSAREGKLLLQLVSRQQELRIDVFRQYGRTLSRAGPIQRVGDVRFVPVEDLRARVTAHVCSSLARGLVIDRKHVESFWALGLAGEPQRLDEAWRDHREEIEGTIGQATETVRALVGGNPHLIIVEEYGIHDAPCERCEPRNGFRLASPDVIASILGYN
jgi:hypothetical protein